MALKQKSSQSQKSDRAVIGRLSLRLAPKDKALLKKAAAASHQSLNSFVISCALGQAATVVKTRKTTDAPASGSLADFVSQGLQEKRNATLVSERDWEFITGALENPPPLHPRLAAAFQDLGHSARSDN